MRSGQEQQKEHVKNQGEGGQLNDELCLRLWLFGDGRIEHRKENSLPRKQ